MSDKSKFPVDRLYRHGAPDKFDEHRSTFNWATGFVGIGLVGTTWALVSGLRAMMLGQKYKSQNMMRARVLSQGFSVAALLVGLLINNKQAEEGKQSAKRQFFARQEAMKQEQEAVKQYIAELEAKK